MGEVIHATNLYWGMLCLFRKGNSYHCSPFGVGPFKGEENLKEWRKRFVRSLVFLAKKNLSKFSIMDQEIAEFFAGVNPWKTADAGEDPEDSAYKFYEVILELLAESPIYDYF